MARAILLALMVLAYPFSDYLAGNAWTYMFAHASLAHLALNAITLWSFSKPVERELGVPQTLALFMVAAVVGGAVQLLIAPSIAGASAGILGLVACYVARHPTVRIGLPLLMFEGGVVMAVLVLASLLCITRHWLTQIAHLAHLVGIAVGVAWSRSK